VPPTSRRTDPEASAWTFPNVALGEDRPRDFRFAVADLFNQKVEGTAWKTKPSWYIVGTQDRTVNPELQRFAAKRMKAATTEVTSSHVPMLSKPDVVLDVIRKAASAVPSP
jgi:pimeloyl-ACP methyl ester carboxylesterase